MSIKQYIGMLVVVMGCVQMSLAYKTMPRDKRYSDTVYKESKIPMTATECSNPNNQCYCSFKCDYRDRVDAEDVGMWVGVQHKCYCKRRDIESMTNCDLVK